MEAKAPSPSPSTSPPQVGFWRISWPWWRVYSSFFWPLWPACRHLLRPPLCLVQPPVRRYGVKKLLSLRIAIRCIVEGERLAMLCLKSQMKCDGDVKNSALCLVQWCLRSIQLADRAFAIAHFYLFWSPTHRSTHRARATWKCAPASVICSESGPIVRPV